MSEESPVEPLPMMSPEQMLALSGTRRFKTLPCPPLGSLRIRSLLADEEVMIANYPYDQNGRRVKGKERYMRANRLIHTIVDLDGNPVFSEEHVERIALWPEPLMAFVYKEAVELSEPDALPLWAKN